MAELTQDWARQRFEGPGGIMGRLIKQLAPPRPEPVPLVGVVERTQGHPLGAELLAWVEQLERFELELVDPALSELRAPGSIPGLDAMLRLNGPAWIADFVGQLTACSVIVQQDELSYLASWQSTEAGASKVFSFHPSDWGLWPSDASITARLFRLLDADRGLDSQLGPLFGEAAPPDAALDWPRLVEALPRYEAAAALDRLPPSLDPGQLFARVDWLVHALLGVAGGPPLARALSQAAPYSAYEAERPLIARWPHLALYWLWSHFFFGNEAALAETMAAAAALSAPVVVESIERIRGLVAGELPPVGPHSGEALMAWRARIGRMAQPAQLCPPRRWRAEQGPREAQLREAESLARLRLEIAADPAAQANLRALEQQCEAADRRPKLEDMEALADALDARFTPYLLRRLARSLAVEDGHPEAGAGLILAWAALAEDLAQFEAQLARYGTARIGTRRQAELYQAYARFEEPRATEQLARGAAAWLAEVEDWIRMTPDTPVRALLARDSLQTHRFVASLLETASFSAANWQLCLEAARTAERIGSTRAAAGLRRAVARGLGRLEDGGRLDVVRALVRAEGPAAEPWLGAQLARWAEAWAEDEDTASEAMARLSPLLFGLLQLAPDRPEYHALSRALLKTLRAQITAARTPSLRVLASAHAILAGIRAGEVSALRDALPPWRSLAFPRTPSTARLAEAIAVEVQAATCEL